MVALPKIDIRPLAGIFGKNETIGAPANAPAVDVVAVYSKYKEPSQQNPATFIQVFAGARPIKATINETAQLMRHPLESGSTFVDHRIINPIQIQLSMVLTPASYKDTYNQIKQLFLNSALLIVQTKTGVYRNMLIASMPHDEDPEVYDTIMLAITLEEAKLVTVQFGKLPASTVENKTNSSTEDTGQKQPKSAAADLLGRAQEGVRKFFSGS